MSSRMLKKLHGDNDLDIAVEPEEILSEVENDTGNGSRKKHLNINRYDLLNQQSPSESEVKEDDNETEHASAAANNLEQSKKKKRKRKKRSGKQSNQARRSSEDNADIDDLVRTVKEVDKMFGVTYESAYVGQPPSPIRTGTSNDIKSLFAVQHKNLNPAYEMKRMFGARVVQTDNKRRNQRGQRTLRSTWLVTAKENWPPIVRNGLYMSIADVPEFAASRTVSQIPVKSTAKAVTWFKFEHGPLYRTTQQRFLAAVESMNSDNIIQIMHQQPYHVDSLIQLSELSRMTEDNAMASLLIDHALYALESSFLSTFSLTSGNCRLDYRRQENRSLFVVLFKHAQYLERRACSRTALEVAKLILSFEPDHDPLAIILCIDFYALRSRQYSWLAHLYEEWEVTNNLAQLPNMAYSYALALFLMGAETLEKSDKSLQYALMMFPGLLRPMLTELSVQIDARAGSHNYFAASAYTNQSPALQQLVSLYVARANLVWRDTKILAWLERNTAIVMDRVDAKDPLVADFATKRTKRYVSPPRAILRHVVLSDYKEKVPLANFMTDAEPILMFDPLPPLDSINAYEPPIGPRAQRNAVTGFSLFFQSWFPSYNAQQQEQGGGNVVVPQRQNALVDQQQQQEEGGGGNDEMSPGLTAILDAMRGFLNNMDDDENESTDDEQNDYLT